MQSNNSPLHQVLKEYINITIILHLSPDQSSYATHTFYSNLSRILVWFVTKGDSYMPCKAMALSTKYICGGTEYVDNVKEMLPFWQDV